jgi:hypothetical protein
VSINAAYYEKLEALVDLYQKLRVAEDQSCSEEGRVSHEEMMKTLRKRLNS